HSIIGSDQLVCFKARGLTAQPNHNDERDDRNDEGNDGEVRAEPLLALESALLIHLPHLLHHWIFPPLQQFPFLLLPQQIFNDGILLISTDLSLLIRFSRSSRLCRN